MMEIYINNILKKILQLYKTIILSKKCLSRILCCIYKYLNLSYLSQNSFNVDSMYDGLKIINKYVVFITF